MFLSGASVAMDRYIFKILWSAPRAVSAASQRAVGESAESTDNFMNISGVRGGTYITLPHSFKPIFKDMAFLGGKWRGDLLFLRSWLWWSLLETMVTKEAFKAALVSHSSAVGAPWLPL